MKKVYIIHNFVAGFYAVFDSEKKLKDFIIKEKINYLKEINEDFLEHEDYCVVTCNLNEEKWSDDY